MGDITYDINPQLGAIAVYGWLPIAPRRDNLHQVLFAIGGSVRQSDTGMPVLDILRDGDASAIDQDRIFIGGDIEYNTPITEVDVTEHAYLAKSTDETVTLYEGSVAQGEMIKFDEPVHGLAVTGSIGVLAQGANYAVLSAGAGTLTGKKYSHTTKVYVLKTGESNAETTMSVQNATLVNTLNAPSVASRIMAYNTVAETISTDIVINGEQPGSKVSFIDPDGVPSVGYIESLDINMSNLLRASAVIAKGYKPSKPGNYYEHAEVIASDQIWTVPDGVEQIAVVVIGPGRRGSDGNDGLDCGNSVKAGNGVWVFGSRGGAGGVGGAGGSGGQIMQSTLRASQGQTFEVSVTDTRSMLGEISSEDGIAADAGYVEIISGVIYGAKGPDGFNGGDGGDGGGWFNDIDPKNGTYEEIATPGGAVGDAQGGAGGQLNYYEVREGRDGTSNGGGGGGGAYGSSGGKGENGIISYDSDGMIVRAAPGGDGATALAPNHEPTHGSGGHGGHGGGGAGGWGGAILRSDYSRDRIYAGDNRFDSAHPGKGSAATDGHRGCVIIYY